jgi:protein subunit release factor A
MKTEMDMSEILIETCRAEGQSPHICSALKGIKLTHKISGIIATSIKEKSQRANYLAALELLKLKLVKQRFETIDEDDLVDGKAFLQELDLGKYD